MTCVRCGLEESSYEISLFGDPIGGVCGECRADYQNAIYFDTNGYSGLYNHYRSLCNAISVRMALAHSGEDTIKDVQELDEERRDVESRMFAWARDWMLKGKTEEGSDE